MADRQTFLAVWEDQERFNRMLRPNVSEAERDELIKDLVLGLTDEAHEFLRVGVWKKHRNLKVRRNTAHGREEIVDMFKFLMTIAQTYGMTPQELLDGYWDKSAVVEMRYWSEWSEAKPEWPHAVVDIDGILCDYARGLATWLLNTNAFGARRASDNWPLAAGFLTPAQKEYITGVERDGGWLDARSTGVDVELWETLKRIFRLSGAKRTLPVYPDAAPFLSYLYEHYTVVLLTSRPIGEYPNMLTDTVAWLKFNGLTYDHIWWAMEKTDELIARNVLPHTAFAIDDDDRYLSRYKQAGVRVIQVDRTRTDPTYHDTHGPHWVAPDLVHARSVIEQFRKDKDQR